MAETKSAFHGILRCLLRQINRTHDNRLPMSYKHLALQPAINTKFSFDLVAFNPSGHPICRKKTTMQTITAQQEILLMTGTSFSLRNWCEKETSEDQKKTNPEDMLKEACWNGMLPYILPEICKPSLDDKKLFLWDILEANSFIDVVMGDVPGATEKYFSINPYLFLDQQLMS